NASYVLSEADIENGGVILTITTEAGDICPAATDAVEVIITDPLIANFDVVNACAGQPTQFMDQTLVLSGSIDTWQWNFGNGMTSSEQNPPVTYSSTRSYTVRLFVTYYTGYSY